MITIDFETKSYADLIKVGTWAYAQDPTTDAVCVCWGIDDQPIQSWWPDHMCPDYDEHMDFQKWWTGDGDAPARIERADPNQLFAAIGAGHEVEAHNVAFERSIWENQLVTKYDWVLPHDDQWRDTMALCAYYALPMALDKVCRMLGYEPKSPEGGRLITKYSKLYLKTAKQDIPQPDFEKFVDYCIHDVQMEQSLSDHLGDLPDRELPNFLFDQKVNRRGLFLDLHGIEVAAKIVDDRSKTLTAEFRKLTGVNPTQRDKCMAWFEENGLVMECPGDTAKHQQGQHEEARRDGTPGR
jgi:DNA polymerase